MKLSRCQVPERATTLVGKASGRTYIRQDDLWAYIGDVVEAHALMPRSPTVYAIGALLDYEEEVTVVFPEPRKWPKITKPTSDDMPLKIAVDGRRWYRVQSSEVYATGYGRRRQTKTFSELRLMGDVKEVNTWDPEHEEEDEEEEY